MTQEQKPTSTALSLSNEETSKPTPPEKEVAQIVAETKTVIETDEDDEELLLDEGGDFFWLLQNVIWGTLKSIFIIIVLGALIWIIWGKSSPEEREQAKNNTSQEVVTTPKKETEKEKKAETPKEEKPSFWERITAKKEKEPAKETKKNDRAPSKSEGQVNPLPTTEKVPNEVATSIPATEIVEWHLYLEQKRLFGVNESYFEGTDWIQRAQNIYAIPLPRHIKGSNEYERQLSLETFLKNINKLLSESIQIRSTLFEAKQEAAQKAAIANQQIQVTQNLISNVLNKKDNRNLPSLVNQKAEFGKTYTFNNTNDQVYGWMIASMEQYDKSLRSMYEIMYANQAAIAKDVRVVNFPSDPFQRVISPTEWRGQ